MPLPRDVPRDEAGDRPGERGLAGPGRPDHEQDTAGVEPDVDPVERGPISPGVPEPDTFGRERKRASRPGRRGQAGNPSSTPARRRERTSACDPSATITIAEIAIAIPRATWTSIANAV